ncbi:nuclear mRNA export, poly(A)+RNA binding protein [Friedmanniomyces endolithicus]|nr:nuclear mRNA export, poly(A)+RNA binding protein [Friedmanniomyces endolithicus]KAK0285485.1 nuclear mRNA export, poly(A)+RNA binding protein [Friedmanniomyces endolithicus]
MVVPSYTDRDRDHNRNRKTAKAGPSGVQRSYASELRESEGLFNSYEHLQGLQREDAALKMLRQVASLVKPIMRKRGWTVQILAEFLPPEQNLLGLNVNKGYKICLRLRYHNNPDLFLPTEQVVDTMLHELSHNVWGAHDSNFHKLWDELRDEHEILVRKGYTGEGFLSEGHRVGGGRHGVPSPHEMRRLARASAEKRSTQGKLGKGSGQRLGGAPIHQQGGDVRQVIADSVARRNMVDRGCASGRQDAAKLAEQASSNTFRTKAEEDDANDRAIAQALFELMEQEEERNITNGGFSTAPTDGGLAWSSKDGLYEPENAVKPSPVSPHQPTEDEQLVWALHHSMTGAPKNPSQQTMSPVSPLTPAAGTNVQTISTPTQPTYPRPVQPADKDLFEISSNIAPYSTKALGDYKLDCPLSSLPLSRSTASKFFPAMMRVLELSFDKPEERDAAVTSVSLANNDLVDLAAVTTLSQTLPKLENLDLSNNNFGKLEHLHSWRRRFTHLQHLILTGNPLEQNEPSYQNDVISWYPNLRQLNGVQVRTEEDIVRKIRTTDLPFPIRSPHFKDEGGIAEQFVRTYFAGFDNDRAALALHYYDEQSDFSYAVNTQAPRDSNSTQRSEPGEWESYLKSSRNLKKIQQLPARQARKYRGTQAVAEALAMLPGTRHPDLASEARKWMVEAKMVPGVPDPTGASPGGVDGFLITVHGEFEELNLSGQSSKKRSFDRSFVLGPGGVAGVRIVSDMLTLRSYGGAQAFEPETFDAWSETSTTIPVAEPAAPGLPAGLSIAEAEQMVAQLMQQTGMTLSYAKDCLDQVGWNYLGAVEAFGKVRGSLPAEAFVVPTA